VTGRVVVEVTAGQGEDPTMMGRIAALRRAEAATGRIGAAGLAVRGRTARLTAFWSDRETDAFLEAFRGIAPGGWAVSVEREP
jgi:hypothetical protein